MLIIADKKIPENAKNKLSEFGELVLLETSGITEESISGHPDIFFCKVQGTLIVAPNLPDTYKNILTVKNISFIEGKLPVGMKYPDAARYNAVITDKYIIHNRDITDPVISKNCGGRQLIHVNQGFTRCSLLALNNGQFITSDEGIYKTLITHGFHPLVINATDILLPGHKHGFFGGTCGIYENKIFILGNLDRYSDGDKIKLFLDSLGYDILEIYDGPLFDAGSIMFIPQ